MSLKRVLVALMGVAVFGTFSVTDAAENAPRKDENQQSNQKKADEVMTKAQQQVPQLGRVMSELRGPDDHDRATAALGLEATLANFHMRSTVTTPLGPALHIPVQISKRDGGRKSLYFIKTGEQVIAGVYVIGSELYYRAVRRDSGEHVPAETGDLFTESILSTDGAVVHESQGRLQILDFSRGMGMLEPVAGGNSLAAPDASVWVGWSFVKVEW
ncbi:MAG TPA: hypothetical protein VF794_03035 [Archangium sp.]|jgi:hypothetical protein|uniref:hypothetical protein n=1 Tax=Archangium sp. TaxID=1872627 RepID=UPI002EDA6016